MNNDKVIQIINKLIEDVKPFLTKFKEGTSQHSLCKNRINSLEVANSLILNDDKELYNNKELKMALKPIESIISKTSKVVKKLDVGSYQYNRSIEIIEAMNIARNILLLNLKE